MAITKEMVDTVNNFYESGIQAAVDLRNNWSSRILIPINPDSIVGVGIVTLADNCADEAALTGFERECFTTGFYTAFESKTTEYTTARERMAKKIANVQSWIDGGDK